MTGYWRLVTVSLRTAPGQILGWALAVSALLASSASTISNNYTQQAERDAYAAAYVGTQSSAALQGRGYNLDTVGGILANEMGYLTLIMLPLIGLHLAIRFTRSVEDTGRLDILTAGPVHRLAPAAAGLTAAALTAVLTFLFSAAALVTLDYPVAGSLRYAGGLGALMLAFTGIGALVAQCCRDARTSYVLAIACWMVSYLARAVVDARGVDLTWVNPESWLAEIRPFAADAPLWPWIAIAATAAVSFAAAGVVATRRDQGAGLIPPRPGPATAPAWMTSPLRLLTRLTFGVCLGWFVGGSLFAFSFGYLTQQMSVLSAISGTTRDDNVDATLSLFVQMNALLAAAAAIQLIQWLAAEETAGRVGYALASPVSRRRWWAAGASLVTASSLILLVGMGVSTGLGLAAGFGDAGYLDEGLPATLAYAPAVLLIEVVALALLSVSPRAVTVTWLAVGWGVVVCLRADLLDLPEWARRLSPLDWVGAVPRDTWDRPVALAMTLLALALAAAALLAFQRRDLRAG
jgi:polyether ionophore transport system permease protein